MRNEVTDLLIEELSKYGLKGTISDRSKHLEVSWDGIAGSRFIIAPKTPSDWRSSLNARSDLRKMLRKDNQPLLEDRPMSFQKAMSLPKETLVTQVARDRALQRDVEVLCDVVMELQEKINSLHEKLESVTVVSTVMSSVKFAGQQTVEEPVQPKILERKERPSSTEIVFNCVGFVWTQKSEILKLSGLNAGVVNQALMRLRAKGWIENGQRGMWRRKPDVPFQ